MDAKNAVFYRARAEECRNEAAKAKDPGTRKQWQQVEESWLELAKYAERLAKQHNEKQS